MKFIGNSHRDATDHTVVTDYSINPLRVFSGTVPGLPKTPGATSPFMLRINGGEIVVDGVTVRAKVRSSQRCTFAPAVGRSLEII